MAEHYLIDNLIVLLAAVVETAQRDAKRGSVEASTFLRELRSATTAPIPLRRQLRTATRQWAVYGTVRGMRATKPQLRNNAESTALQRF